MEQSGGKEEQTPQELVDRGTFGFVELPQQFLGPIGEGPVVIVIDPGLWLGPGICLGIGRREEQRRSHSDDDGTREISILDQVMKYG